VVFNSGLFSAFVVIYSPAEKIQEVAFNILFDSDQDKKGLRFAGLLYMVGPGGFEPPTSTVSR
jgi:hypothetical protein